MFGLFNLIILINGKILKVYPAPQRPPQAKAGRISSRPQPPPTNLAPSLPALA